MRMNLVESSTSNVHNLCAARKKSTLQHIKGHRQGFDVIFLVIKELHQPLSELYRKLVPANESLEVASLHAFLAHVNQVLLTI